MRSQLVLAVAASALVLVSPACGGGAKNATAGPRSIAIEMRNVKFSPDHVTVHKGDTVRFVFQNADSVPHDAVIGDATAQNQHEMAMAHAGGMNHSGNPDAVTIAPGETGALTHTFRAGDRLLIGCHEHGHYAAGMKLTISVS